MEYVKLGNTGLDISPICLGCMSFGTAEGWVHNPWALSEESSCTIIKQALDLGVNFFDTANAYAYGKDDVVPGDHPPNREIEIRLIPADGGVSKTLVKLFGGQATMNVNSWSPDSRRLAFMSYRLKE